jgi:uncharacterized RDD family membrane protein YckC
MAQSIEQIDWTHWIYRLIALIIDSIITGIIGGIIYTILLIPIILTGAIFGNGPWLGSTLLFPFIYGIVLVIYSAFLETTWAGTTIGKRLLGMQVQTTSGGKITFDKAFLRNISKIYWIFLFIDWLLGILTPGNKRQKYTDRIAGTMVIQTGAAFGSAPPPPPPPT